MRLNPTLLLLGAVGAAVSPRPTSAQVASDSTAVVVPGAHYQAGGLHRFFLGDTYRDLWNTPVRAPVLDLATHFGGLMAVERGGSKQSRSLRFRAADGRMLVFRALDKDPTQTWPPGLRRSLARRFAEDQISAILPGGAAAVAVIEQAAGLVNPGVSLVVLPDDPRLGEWRDEFKGNLGILEFRIRGTGAAIQDLPGASRVVSSEGLFERLREEGRNVVDGPAFLTARLVDLLIGDWDRHGGQWAWARYDEGAVRRWVPLPRDRDWAFSHLDGPLYSLLRLYLPKYQSFGRGYGSIYGLTLSAEALDRRLLTGLDRATWDSVAQALVARIDDAVIDAAVAALPPEYDRAVAARLTEALRTRRDDLPAASGRFYRQLAGVVELRGSDEPDRVDIRTETGGALRVTLASADSTAVRVDRVFVPGETREIRLYLRGADDALRWHGETSPIRIRVIDPEGLAPDAPPGTVSVSDSTSPFRSPVDPDDPLLIHRDWGTLYGVLPWFEARPEIGVLVGGGPVFYRYGFERAPYASRLAFRMATATGQPGVNLDFDGDFRFRGPGRFLLRAGLLRIDVVRYFGAGNETPRRDSAGYYDVRQRLYYAEPTVELPLGRRGVFRVGAFARASRTNLDDASLLADERPYGSGDFGLVGGSLEVAVDSRDQIAYPTRGVTLSAGIRASPKAFDASESFAVTNLRAAGYLTASGVPARPTLALRGGLSRAFGATPFFEAPTIGGRSSIRGLNSRRFLGRAAAFGSAEVRLDLGSFLILVPGEWGVSGLADIGRVWLPGESSRTWHSAGGGGLWFAFLDRRATMTVTYARSEERTKLYLQAGFPFD